MAEQWSQRAAKVAAELGIRAPLLYRWAWPTSSTSAARSGGEVRDGEDVIASPRTRSPEIFISFKVS
jgi:hypothetical protein